MEKLVLKNEYEIVVPLFGAALAEIEFLTLCPLTDNFVG